MQQECVSATQTSEFAVSVANDKKCGENITDYNIQNKLKRLPHTFYETLWQTTVGADLKETAAILMLLTYCQHFL